METYKFYILDEQLLAVYECGQMASNNVYKGSHARLKTC